MYSQSHYPLQNLNSFGVSAFANCYIRFNRLTDIEHFCSAVDSSQNPIYILGGGSNTLFVRDFPGYILHVQLPGIEVIKETSSKVVVKAAAGVNWHKLVLFCVDRGYGGIENLSLIPGMVGGAPLQNIGAYGVELKDVLTSVETIELATGRKRIFKRSECAFGYRSSIFKTRLCNQYLITAIVLILHKGAKFSIAYEAIQKALAEGQIKQLSFKVISDIVIAIRRKRLPDPMLLGNAGSFFQNPIISTQHYRSLKAEHPNLVSYNSGEGIKISAAWLIEKAGFKGFRKGNVGVYDAHALILVHYGGGTGEEIIALATQIKDKVQAQFNITLVPEVNIVGGTL